ncbi:carbonic anhydrase [Enhygromyxa salina]|uniref:carbonic anhydrase n=1 Tax=Enhygromyxa salina TaxID=215803 RepID=UPI000D08E9D5|nr:carbonic anhydrase [Enhygromyxa salina]
MPTDTPDLFSRVFENNRRWARQRSESDPEYFKRLASGQKPEVLYIGCADSRVPANEIMGLDPGDVFVHRNIANLVVNTDSNAQSVIQYAVDVLKVRHVVVCGHYGCGGIQAAMRSEDLGQLNGWLREVRDVFRIHHDELMAIPDERERYRRLVQLNVEEQCVNVIKTSWVQRNYREHGFPTVHGWCFGLEDGLLEDLKVPFVDILEGIREIYHLD